VERFPGVDWEESDLESVARVPAQEWRAFAEAAKDMGFEMCSDVTAVDWLRSRSDRYQIVASLVSISKGERLRMVTTVGRESPSIDSLTPVWPGAGFAEREVYDMFGVVFDGHPDMTRILMPDDWEGHPLRKDYGIGAVPVQFKAAHRVG
jgi:NADH-quinone oxidoreductase subunit C